jgi:hypothetical protein
MICHACIRVFGFGFSPLAAICESFPTFSPLLSILLLDGMKTASRAFRFALPFAYVLFVSSAYVLYGYVYIPHDIIDLNITLAGSQVGTDNSYEGHAAGALFSLLLLMFKFLLRAITDRGLGSTISFPIHNIRVHKEAVPFLLEMGGRLEL